MPVLVKAPNFPWLAKVFRCPHPECGAEVQFFLEDTRGLSGIKPRFSTTTQRWTIAAQCPGCGLHQHLQEIPDETPPSLSPRSRGDRVLVGARPGDADPD